MFSRLREDLANVLEHDPAARSRWEVLTCYPGMHALWLHRRLLMRRGCVVFLLGRVGLPATSGGC